MQRNSGDAADKSVENTPSPEDWFIHRWRLPEYERAASAVLAEASSILVTSSSELLRMVRKQSYSELPKQVMATPEGEIEFKGESLEAKITESVDGGWEGDLQTAVEQYALATEGHAQQLTSMVLRHIGQVTEATGHVVNGKGRPLDYDIITDMLERCALTFEEDGTVSKTCVFVNAQGQVITLADMLKKLPQPTKEQEERYQSMMSEKLEEWRAGKRTRRLS